MPCELVPGVLFKCDGCCFDMFAVSGDYAACFVFFFVILIMQDLLLWLWSPLPSTVPCVYGPPSSH